ncbi:urea ABC transporter permease subunit UrtB [Falsirhodobacter halotolerans]|uniref:urea ABC transporter permease subunit UrtB n=1 Tax=Falsirhodobacter halotolerans TaxID=1146892 RepID=UPI001FD4F1EF|nr:urea ABC transporter permease subunit UrtB [Falsirhodobacter halotolerans]MCJ8139107.1 urea ABC transporter permease subunit UrtB [Falsirhodobacter halotolerans]
MQILLSIFFMLTLALPVAAQDLATVLNANRDQIVQPSRTSIGPVIDAIANSGDPAVRDVLAAWEGRRLAVRQADGAFVIADGDRLTDLRGAALPAADVTVLRPNAGVRGLIASALVQFQLTDPDPVARGAARDAIARNAAPEHLPLVREALANGSDADLARLERLLTLRFDPDPAARVVAIQGFGATLSLDVRAALNPLLATRRVAAFDEPVGNIARILSVADLGREGAYDLLVQANLAPARLTPNDAHRALVANIVNGQVAGVPVAALDTAEAREGAYSALEAAGTVPTAATEAEVDSILDRAHFADVYVEPDAVVTDAARAALLGIQAKLGAMQAADLALDALSLASIYFLAAIGLAITFGVMRVINMAHGDFIMMGAYTGYVVQQIVPDRTLSLVVALPLAFLVTFAAGVVLERLVIRHLYHRPLETLLATFGVSIMLQQLAKNIFGTQARPLTAPDWLSGSWALNDIVGISWIRVAIFVLALLFLGLYLFIMRRTRLGLEVRAVQQNPTMAASMGISPNRINMLAFGLGSGIAGIAGVAIGLFAQVTSELGQQYIVQSFMTVVVGGVGNIFGTLAGAALIGFLQKGIEWLNPSNTLAAQTYMILFIIIFIQFRPRGIIALKGRAAGD